MGLFSSKQKRNFLDILGLQISPELESRLIEISKEDSFTDYATDIKENFELFDRAVFRIFGHKKDLSGNSSFNLILENNGQSITINKIKEMVDSISNEYGKDRTGKSKWNVDDDKAISTYWEGREWIIDKKGNTYRDFKGDCIQINLHYNLDEDINFSILGANDLINK
jgi:hypothetical protein